MSGSKLNSQFFKLTFTSLQLNGLRNTGMVTLSFHLILKRRVFAFIFHLPQPLPLVLGNTRPRGSTSVKLLDRMRTSLSANLFREWLKYRQDNVTKQYNSNCFTPFIPYTHTTGGHEHNSNVSFKKCRWTISGFNLGSPTDLEEFCHTKCMVATKITANCALLFLDHLVFN